MGAWAVVLLVLASWLALSLAVAAIFVTFKRWRRRHDRANALTDPDEKPGPGPGR